jgi:addiction module RelB/DinJ family antitoxin
MTKVLINIKADKAVKEKAQKIAKDLGMPLSVVVNGYLQQFIRTKEVHFFLEGELKPVAKKRLDRLEKEARAGENVAGPFTSSAQMDDYLSS